MFVWKQSGDLIYLELEMFADYGIRAYFTSRQGGISSGNYSSLNLALHTDDNQYKVLENRRKIARAINIDSKDFVAGEQIHADRVYIVKKEDRGRGALDYEDSIPGTDALLTDKKKLPLISFYADCVPLFLMDPVKKVVGLAHAGWKGTVKRIVQKALISMRESFGSDITDIYVAIGPCISRDIYQVDKQVMDRFKSTFNNWQDFIIPDKQQGYFLLDLKRCNRYLCQVTGVCENHIIVSDLCTYTNDYFYSYRKEGITGRMASITLIE